METNLAVLIDFENIAAGTDKEGLGRFDIDALMARVKDKGRILVARSYADWGRFARFKQSLLSNNVTMYELTSHGMQDKNRADIAMVVDCLELAFTRDYVDTFVVVSGDSDFTPLVLKLRELRKRVIGIGTRRSTSRLLINACDEFIFYDSIVEQKQARPRRRPASKAPNKAVEKAMDFLVEMVEGLMRENPTPPLASIVKTAMLRRQPDFSESDIGFSSFTRFLEAARNAGVVTLEKDKKSGTYAVDTLEDGQDAVSASQDDDRSEAPRSKPASRLESGAYADPYYPDNVDDVITHLHKAGLGPMAFSTRMAVLEHLVEVVTERAKRRQRANASTVADAVKQRLRRTHPELTKDDLEALIKGLREADVLIHKDGRPIRRSSASFRVNKSAEELNLALAEHYIRLLRDAGHDVSRSKPLAALFLGDEERARKVEEIVAWAAAPPPAASTEPAKASSSKKSSDEDDDDVDAFLELDDGAEVTIDQEETPAPKKRPARKRTSRSARAKAAKEAPKAEGDAAPDAEPGPAAEPEAEPEEPAEPAQKPEAKPAAKTRTRKSTKKAPAKADAPEDAPSEE